MSITSLAADDGTSSRGTRVLGILTLVGTAAVAYLGLVATGPDVIQRDSVRLIYVHVPMVSVMYVPVAICSIASLLWLRKRSDGWDALAVAAAEVATVFVGLGLVTGAIWGRPTWGVYWTWDARLTSTAMLFILLLGYLTMRRLPDERSVRTKRAAVVGLLLIPNAIIVKFSVDWWLTLHQDATITRADAQIEGLQQFTLILSVVVGYLGMAWLMVHRFRIAWLESRIEDRGLDLAIAERRAEGDTLVATGGDQ
ncbi:MAG TPA: cytochrome c biogenesis protein CcsA [Acidimicrobiales bacterium]|nr:cytochrome c biogenesis protein CcsA [Acidimicrobiales bacterium]